MASPDFFRVCVWVAGFAPHAFQIIKSGRQVLRIKFGHVQTSRAGVPAFADGLSGEKFITLFATFEQRSSDSACETDWERKHRSSCNEMVSDPSDDNLDHPIRTLAFSIRVAIFMRVFRGLLAHQTLSIACKHIPVNRNRCSIISKILRRSQSAGPIFTFIT